MQFLTGQMMPLALTLSIQIFAVSSMLMVGLRYTIGDLARPLRDIRGVVIALATNFVLVPLLALLLLRLIPLDPDFSTGLVIVASAGGAPLIVKLVMNAGEDVGFAASQIVLLLAGTILAMPIILPLVSEAARISAWAIARPLIVTMILPLAAGFILRPVVPGLAARAVPVLGTILVTALWIMVGLSLFLNRHAVLNIFGEGAIFVSLLFIGLAFGLGYIAGSFDKAERIVFGFGAAQRNFAAAMVVATQAFEEPGVVVMVVVLSIVAMLLIPFSTWLGRRKSRGEGHSIPS
ncbi:MAG: bile acid:sodium symporter [Gemmobacter sp.]|jgi:BASS family bile acid:Na+ symporter|nr:bile acid:sodium symporter [Gemmobacter sp.]